MKRWRKIVIFTMILALPISMLASMAMASHCQNTDISSHSMDGNESMLAHDQIPSPDSNNLSECDCECDDNLNCSVSGCSATALINETTIDLGLSTHSVYQRIESLADPSEPELLFRPPISLS